MALVEFKNYSFTHLGQVGGKALSNINLKFEEGTTVGILGNAGAGKSTLIKAMGGLAPVEVPGFAEGEILIDGKDSRTLDPMSYSRMVGVVLDNPATQLLGLTVLDDVAFGPSNLGLDVKDIRERVDFALKVTRLKGMEARNPEELSGGQQQSLAIADILAMRPRVLAMDEPVSMLDAEGKDRVLSIIRTLAEEKSTVVITESGLDLESMIKYLDRLIVLNKGEVFLDGKPMDVMADMGLDKIGVGRTQLAELFMKLRGVSEIREIPESIERAAEILSPRISGMRFSNNREVATIPPPGDGASSPAVNVKNLQHMFPPDVHALRGVDVSIARGEIVGLIGQNGSGKTTLCLHLVGVLKPTNPEASIVVCDLNVLKARFHDIIKKINYVFQNPDNQLFQETIMHELTYGLRLQNFDPELIIPEAARVSKEFELDSYVQDDMDALPREVKTILAMASVMTLKPSVLVLDEPANAMDRVRAAWFIDKLKSLNKSTGLTVIVVSHNMELLAKLCTRLIVMTDGKVVLEGETRKVFAQPEKLAEAKVKPPQITQLAQLLSKQGFPNDVLTADEFFNLIHPEVAK